MDDILVGTFKVTCEGNVIKSEDDAELAVRDQRYDGILLEGFGKASTGKKVGDVVTLDTTLPDDYTDIELREKTAKCELEISLVKRLEVPEMDAAYLETMGFESKKEFEDHVQDSMEQSLRQKVRQEMRNQAREHLLKNADFDIPEGVSQRHTEHLVGQQMMNLYRQGVPDGEISKHADELRTAASEQARNELKLVFMMDKIAEDMKVDVSEEEINGAIATIAARRNRRFDRVRDEIISTGHLRTLYVQLRDEKVLEKLLDDADVSEVEEKDKAPSSKKKAPSDKKKTAAKGKKKKDDSE
ncbi:MAG: hypothetical protein GXP29_01235 [Planctomycetes bacterium]|nr:hypothetical protein [Planctomycetota bacterium]